MNRPRNVLLRHADPREDVVCEFRHSVGALRHSFCIHQTPGEPTWPGGALWDCGVLLSQLLLAVAGVETMVLKSTLDVEQAEGCSTAAATKPITKKGNNKDLTTSRTTTQLSTRFKAWLAKSPNRSVWAKEVEEVLLHRTGGLKILELGCGVGLTGLVASVALGAVTTVLTDLAVVAEEVTIPNVLENTDIPPGKKSGSNYRTLKHFKGGGKVVAMPLCWGDQAEGEKVLNTLKELQPTASTSTAKKGKKKKAAQSQPQTQSSSSSPRYYPDVVLLGDVAYQHKPGAPSHFDILVETLLQTMPPITEDDDNASSNNTLLLFGTRLRMPASMDLLLLLQERFSPVLQEPIPAQVLDPALEGVKHNMAIHVFTNKKI